jgi:hypothetical protein
MIFSYVTQYDGVSLGRNVFSYSKPEALNVIYDLNIQERVTQRPMMSGYFSN